MTSDKAPTTATTAGVQGDGDVSRDQATSAIGSVRGQSADTDALSHDATSTTVTGSNVDATGDAPNGDTTPTAVTASGPDVTGEAMSNDVTPTVVTASRPDATGEATSNDVTPTTAGGAGGSPARDRLLDAVVDHVAAHGVGDLSLRALAAEIGTSHRMLIYHFGSKQGLLAAVVQRVEDDQRAVLDALASADALPAREALDLFWAGLADPAMHDRERLFFEVVAQALQGRPGTESLRATLVEPWLDTVAAHGIRAGLSPDVARAQARLGMAVTRGLLLDLLATGDRDGVDAAWTTFADTFAPTS